MISHHDEKYLIKVINMFFLYVVSVESVQKRYATSCTQEVTSYSYYPHPMLLMAVS
jgi:hypothetical protein